ncbi:site-specific DNA-cytosine methylase [Pseudomonas sp. Y3 TE3536]
MIAMRYGSVCSGIEAATEAWHPLGWTADWYAEIEPFPCAVLAYRYPNTPNHGDMTRLAAMVLSGKIPAPEVLVGGTPCQAFSVAGMREGLADPRGALTIKYVELLDAIDHVRTKRGEPEAVCLWENVPGVLSDKGNAFGCFLGALVGESEELQPPGGKWKDAGCVYGPTRTVAWRVLDAQYFGLAQRRRRVFVVASARTGFDPLEVLFEREGPRRDSPPGRPEKFALHPTLTAQGGGALDDREAYVLESGGVRRTTPVEWERCQGFPDNYTAIPWNGYSALDCPAAHRYKALGNSKPVAIVRWIGDRLIKSLTSVSP